MPMCPAKARRMRAESKVVLVEKNAGRLPIQLVLYVMGNHVRGVGYADNNAIKARGSNSLHHILHNLNSLGQGIHPGLLSGNRQRPGGHNYNLSIGSIPVISRPHGDVVG